MELIFIKSAKGHLKQQFIEMDKFRLSRFPPDQELTNVLLKYMSQIMKGVRKAQKSTKLNQQVDRSRRPSVDRAFWDSIISYSKSVGIDLIGFTEVDEYFIFEEEMLNYRVKNNVFDNAIVLGMEMKKEAIDQAPEAAAGSEAMRVYAELGIATNKLADYLREKGFQAQAFHPFGGPVLFPPLAEKAGIGEIGNNGLLVTQEFGPSLRLSMIATDAAPLPDLPRPEFQVKEYCETCGVCVKKCPTGAVLPLDQKIRSSNGKYLTSIDNNKCFPQFFETYGCSICIKVCPFYKLGYEKVMAKASIKVKS